MRAKRLDRHRYAAANFDLTAASSSSLPEDTRSVEDEFEKHRTECAKTAALLHEQRVRAQVPLTISNFVTPFKSNRAIFGHFVEYIRDTITTHFLTQHQKFKHFDPDPYVRGFSWQPLFLSKMHDVYRRSLIKMFGIQEQRQANASMRTIFAQIDTSEALCRFVRDYISTLAFDSVLDLSSRLDAALHDYTPPVTHKSWLPFCSII